MTQKDLNREYHAILEQDKNVSRWYNSLRKGSPIVADIYLRRLVSFCLQNDLTPSSFAKLPRIKMENFTIDFVDEFEKKTNPQEPQQEIRAEMHRIDINGGRSLE